MTRYCCPHCEDHPILDDGLSCCFCGGQYVWKDKSEITYKKGKEALKRLRGRN